MFRSRRSLVLVAVLASVGACAEPKGVDIPVHELLPADAAIAMGFALAPLQASPLGPPLASAARSDSEMAARMDAFVACDVDVAGLRVVLATSDDGNDDKYLGVVEGPGIGTEASVRCLENESRKLMNAPSGGLLVFDTKGDVRTVPQEGGGVLVLLNKDAIAVAGPPWQDALLAAIASPAGRNTSSSMAKRVAEIDRSTHAWAVYTFSEAARGQIPELPGAAGLQSLAVVADLSSGAKLDLSADMADAASAKSLADALAPVLTELKGSLAGAGLPADLLDGVQLVADGPRVRASLSIAADVMPSLLVLATAAMAE